MVKKSSLLARIFRRAGSRAPAGERGGHRVAERLRERNRGIGLDSSPGVARRPGLEPEEEVVLPELDAESSPPLERASEREAPENRGNGAPASLEKKAPDASAEESTPVEAETIDRETELRSTIQQGLQGISSVLDGIDRKIDKQQKTSEELMVSVRKLPEIIKEGPDQSRAGLELLARISTVLENQGRATSELLERMRDLPTAVESLKDGLKSQVEELTRAHKNVDKTMHDTQRQLSNAFQEVRKTVDRTASQQDEKHQRMIQELRAQQSRQDRRVEELLQRQASATKMVVFLLVISIVALLLVVRQIAG